MKSKIAIITLSGALALAVALAGFAFAQEGGPGHEGPMHHGMHAGFMGPEFHMLHQLNLTDDQKAQVKQIFKTERPNMRPLMQQEGQAHLQMMQLITSGNFDPAKATAIANQEAQTHAQMEVEHAKIMAQIFQLLDSNQKSKAQDMVAKHQQMMQQHMQSQEGPSEEK